MKRLLHVNVFVFVAVALLANVDISITYNPAGGCTSIRKEYGLIWPFDSVIQLSSQIEVYPTVVETSFKSANVLNYVLPIIGGLWESQNVNYYNR